MGLLWLMGCNDNTDPVVKKEEATIFFDAQSKLEVREDDDTEIVIPIKLSLSQDVPVTVAYEIIGQEVVVGSDFVVLSQNPLIIPVGATQATVNIKINNNDVIQPEDRNIYLRFRSIVQTNVKVAVPKEVVISIQEDDCLPEIPNVKIWFGNLNLQSENETSTGIGSENVNGLCSGAFNVTGKFVGPNNPESTMTLFLTQDQTLKTKGTVKVTRAKLFSFSSSFEIEATGNYDAITKRITLNYSFFDLSKSANNFESTMLITVN